MKSRWLDLVDPSREELDSALPPGCDPDVIEELLAAPQPGRKPHPVIEAHGGYVFGVLVVMSPGADARAYEEIDFVVTPVRLVTVRKSAGARR